MDATGQTYFMAESEIPEGDKRRYEEAALAQARSDNAAVAEEIEKLKLALRSDDERSLGVAGSE